MLQKRDGGTNLRESMDRTGRADTQMDGRETELGRSGRFRGRMDRDMKKSWDGTRETKDGDATKHPFLLVFYRMGHFIFWDVLVRQCPRVSCPLS